MCRLERAANEAWWSASTHTSAVNDAERVTAELALTELLSDPEMFAAINSALAEVAPGPDVMLRRQLGVLADHFTPHQIDAPSRERFIELGTEVDSAFSSFRGGIDGTAVDDNEITRILRTSNDTDLRRRAWEASKQVGTVVADRVRELVRLRNTAARQLGYRDHFDLVLATSELDEARLFETLDEVDRATARPFAVWKNDVDAGLVDRFSCDLDELRPWHYDNVFFQSPPAGSGVDLDRFLVESDLVGLTTATFDGVGIDVRPIVARSDLAPRDHKNQHAFCADIDRCGDIRVLANNVATEEWAETMLHEFGHAAHADGINPALPWSLRTTHSAVTEGVAMLFGHLTHDPEWLCGVAGVPRHELDALGGQLDASFRAGLLTSLRWVLVMTNFERGLYADPDADHDHRWWDLVEQFQLINRPDGPPTPAWAAKIHIASAPVYYQNYLLGELVALQLRATITQRFGGLVANPDAGRFLIDEVFKPGAALRWDDLVSHTTGHTLTATHLTDALTT